MAQIDEDMSQASKLTHHLPLPPIHEFEKLPCWFVAVHAGVFVLTLSARLFITDIDIEILSVLLKGDMSTSSQKEKPMFSSTSSSTL